MFEKKFHCNVMGFMNDGIQLITNLAVVESHTEMSPGEKRRKWSMSGCQSISCESCLPACKAQALNRVHECWIAVGCCGLLMIPPWDSKTFGQNSGLKYDSARSRKLLASLNSFCFSFIVA